MNREFLLNILFLLFVNLLIKPFYLFGIERTVQNEVPPGDYGLYFALFNFSMVLQILSDLGIQYFNNRNIAQHRFLLGKYFPSILLLKGLLSLLYFAVVIVGARLVGYEWTIFPLLLPIAFNLLLNSLLLYFRSNISGLGMYRTDSFISVLDKLLLIIICFTIFQISTSFQIEWFIYAQTFSLVLTIAVAYGSFYKKLGKVHFQINWAFLWMILKKSFPYALAVLLMGAYARFDGFLLERLLPDGKLEADVYASAYRLLDASNMIGFLFAGLLLPMFARLLKEQQPVAVLLQLSLQLILTGAIALVTATFFYRQDIMLTLYDKATVYSGAVLGVLMLSFIPYCVIYVCGPLLTANQNLRQMNRIFVFAVALNLGLNFFIIPIYASLGAAAVAVLTQLLVAGGQLWLVRREMTVIIPRLILGRLVAFGVLAIVIAMAMQYWWNGHWFLGFLITLGGSLSTAIPLGLIHKNSLIELLQSKRPA